MDINPIIEIVTLTIADGISAEHFAALDRVVEREHVSHQPGFISRESALGEQSTWLVIVHWASIPDAEASMASFADAPAAAAFMAAIKANTMVMTRYRGMNKC
jgi:hypothetical protein